MIARVRHLRRRTKSLTSLDVSGTQVGDDGVHSVLAGLKYLKKFYLRRLKHLKDAGITNIAEVLKRKKTLRVLDFRETPNFRNDACCSCWLMVAGIYQSFILGKCKQVDALALCSDYKARNGLVEFAEAGHLVLIEAWRWHYATSWFASSCAYLVELRLSHLHESWTTTLYWASSRRVQGTIPTLSEIVDLAANYNVSERGLGPPRQSATYQVPGVSLCNKLDDKFGEALANCLQLDEVVMVDSPLLGDRGLTAWARGPPPKKDRYGKIIPVLERTWRPGEPEPKRIRLKLKALTMQAAFSGGGDAPARCRVPRYAEPGLRNLFRKCGKFLSD